MKKLLPAALLLLIVTGCASTPASDTAPEASIPSPSVTEPAATASVARWAGVVAEQQVTLDDWYQSWDDANCSSLAIEAWECGTSIMTGSYIAQTIHLSVSGSSNTASTDYLGAVPADIADLYAETVALTDEALVAAETWRASTCNTDAAGTGCVTLAFTLENALSAVDTKFAAWSPYL